MSNRVNDLLASIPIVTRSLLFINILVHVAIFLTDFPIGMVSISAAQVVVRGEYYRIISAAFVHLGIMHIFMNMMSLYQLGTNIENQFGSIKFLFMSAWGVLITGSIFISMNW